MQPTMAAAATTSPDIHLPMAQPFRRNDAAAQVASPDCAEPARLPDLPVNACTTRAAFDTILTGIDCLGPPERVAVEERHWAPSGAQNLMLRRASSGKPESGTIAVEWPK